jgi:hypothetical protein
VVDRTCDIATFSRGIECNNTTDKSAFAQLHDACNNFLLPTFAYPAYGCSEYLHKREMLASGYCIPMIPSGGC